MILWHEKRIEDLEATVTTLRSELAFYKTTEKGHLREANADLLAALEGVQWVDEGRSDVGPVLVCPACRHGPKQGHGLDCVIGNAIAKAKG